MFEFDSIATADTIYRIVDGPCIHGPIVFDLRFIPDSVEFNSQPHDIATKVLFKSSTVIRGYEDG